MKFPQSISNLFTWKIEADESLETVEFVKQKSLFSLKIIRAIGNAARMELFSQKSQEFLEEIKSIGFTKTMDEYEKRKLSIFNQLNFFQLITGIIVPLICLLGNYRYSVSSFIIGSLPAFVSFLVLCINFYYKYEAGVIFYLIIYPVVTSIVYLNGMNLGVELFFILYGILAVFFVQEIGHMIFSLGLSMISYFVLAVICKKYSYQLQTANIFFYYFNQTSALLFIFYGLFLIKKENTVYQFGILTTNQALMEKNAKIQKQNEEMERITVILHRQTTELSELNSLKNKLFSVIAHDLKSPMYALRNLFNHIEQYGLPASDIRKMIPDVVNDLNYTTGLMENLLHWAKSQMDAAAVRKEVLDISSMIEETIQLMHLQAEAKKIKIRNHISRQYVVFADKDMIGLVIRNLMSNAIKFTPPKGSIDVQISEESAFTEISIQDSGIGIDAESLARINQNNYYSTQGTSNEAGTGLGLMLCKEFLSKNGGQLRISSATNKGSRFSFTVPRPEQPA